MLLRLRGEFTVLSSEHVYACFGAFTAHGGEGGLTA